MTNYRNTARPLWLFNSEKVLVSLILNMLDYVVNTFANMILGTAFIVILVFCVVKLTVSNGAKSNISSKVVSGCKSTRVRLWSCRLGVNIRLSCELLFFFLTRLVRHLVEAYMQSL
jgi:hypothetical protein